MRVTLVSTLERGGPPEHARLLAGHLVLSGARVRAVVTSATVAERFAAVGADPVVVTGRTGWLRAVRRSRDVDVVHSHDRRSAVWTLTGPGRASGPARVHTLHGLDDAFLPVPDRPARPSRRDHVAYRVIEPRLLCRADAVVVPSQATADLAVRLGHDRSRMTVVPNGVEVPAEPPVARGTDVGVIGVLEPVKGLDVFLRAAAVVHRADPGRRFIISGDGSQRSALGSSADALGIAGAVEFAGHVPAAAALARLQVLVLSSHYETAPLVLLEAMAAGVAVVATRVGGIPEQAPPDALLLIEPNDPAALAAAIQATSADPTATAARVARAHRHVLAERTAASTARAVEAVYRRALDRRG